MADELPDPVFDAFRAASARGAMPTAMSTAELRELAVGVRARSVFTARGTSAIFASKIKEVIDGIAAGDIGEADARATLHETLRVLGYTPEGGFPDAPAGSVPPAPKGTLQDLSSFRRMDLIVRTQVDLMRGAGDQARGHTPDRLTAAPAWELIRVLPVEVPRDWKARWAIAGGNLYQRLADLQQTGEDAQFHLPSRMIALKGDPVWGELGSSENFDDALDTDHPPFAFHSGMGWREVGRDEVEALGVTGPGGESAEDFHASQPAVIAGKMPLPSPSLSMKDVAPELVEKFREETKAVPKPAKPHVYDFSELLEKEHKIAAEAYRRQQEERGGRA